jgi:DNA helicase HerA-like ATPase
MNGVAPIRRPIRPLVAKRLVKRMLAEIRSAGIGMIIADQSPRAVSADVVALTNVKMGFRVVESADREMLGSSTNMSEAQRDRLAMLRTGEALALLRQADRARRDRYDGLPGGERHTHQHLGR